MYGPFAAAGPPVGHNAARASAWRAGAPSRPEGVTPSDGQGGVYTVITIRPEKKKLCAHDWNPYFQTRSARGNGQDPGLIAMTELCEDFDLDARFP